MSNFIFEPKQEQSTEGNKKNNNDQEFYTILGQQDYLDENNRPRTNSDTKFTHAKAAIDSKGVKRFYIKIGTYGRIYNPIGMFSEGKEDKFIAKIGKKEYSFKEVNNQVFDLYVNFLSSKNIAWLNNAEREMI